VRTWDTFLFGDELDMLECRLRELDGKVYRHVLVEASLDHQGNSKPLYYAENKERFSAWADQIVHVVADVPTREETASPWDREFAQRAGVWRALIGASAPEDLVLVCDVDEIPSGYALGLQPDAVTALGMRLAMFAVDWVYPEETRIAVAGRRRDLQAMPLHSWRDNGVRARLPLAGGCGWHFTWLGGPAAIERKAGQFCHLELQQLVRDGNAAREWYEQGYTWHGPAAGPYPPPRRYRRLEAAEVDEGWPAYIRERRCPPEWFRPRVDRPAG
jgi:hypothetical protein